eukprot:5677645-Alexandrium_andersonii.AAC.1
MAAYQQAANLFKADGINVEKMETIIEKYAAAADAETAGICESCISCAAFSRSSHDSRRGITSTCSRLRAWRQLLWQRLPEAPCMGQGCLLPEGQCEMGRKLGDASAVDLYG